MNCDVTTCFTAEQISQLLRAINPKRVSTDGKGFSHVEAYDIRAHLTRIFGFGNWSIKFVGGPPRLGFEDFEMRRKRNKKGEEYGDPYKAWTVFYEAAMSLNLRCQHGEWLGPWEDAATGEAQHQPSRGDARDLALKTSVSQAVKRCAANLGDQFGLSLYAKGSTAALIRRTLVMPDAQASENPVDAHITQQLPREDEPAEPQDDPRIVSAPPTPAAPPVAAGPAAGDELTSPSPAADPQAQQQRRAQELREQAVGELPAAYRGQPGKWIAHLMHEAVKAGVLHEPVPSLYSPELVSLKSLLEQALKQATAPETPRERAS